MNQTQLQIRVVKEARKAQEDGGQLSDNPYADDIVLFNTWMGAFMIHAVQGNAYRSTLVTKLVTCALELCPYYPDQVAALMAMAEQNSI